MRESLRSDYFSDLERNFPEHVVSEYKNRLVTIDEMRDLFIKRWEKTARQSAVDLKLDEQTGLYYANHSFLDSDDLLSNHLFAEQLFAKKDKVDWKRMTDCYDYKVVRKIDHALSYPLVWLPPFDVSDEFVFVGDVAAEIVPPEQIGFNDGRYGFYNDMRERGLLWFADTMPTKDDVYDDYRYDDIPDTMLLWDRFLFGGYHDIRSSLEYIITFRGHAKAVEIVERFRKEWDWFLAVKFNDFDTLDNYEKERYRKALFEDLDPYLYSWKNKVQKVEAPQSQPAKDTQSFDTLLQCPVKDKESVMARLHELLDSKGGKQVALILAAAMYKYHYIISMPTEKQYTSTFRLTGSWKAVSSYIKAHTTSNGIFNESIDHIEI